MKRSLSAGVGLFALAVVAQPSVAADLPTKAPAYTAPVAAPMFNWTGFYAGVDAGYLWSEARITYPGRAPYADPDPDGFVLGGHVGYRHQFASNFVLGIEGDISGIFDGEADALVRVQNVNRGILDLRWNASVRGVFGLAVDRWLAYATGGAAVISYRGCEAATSSGPCFGGSSFDDEAWGWTAGAGLAYAMTPNVSARIEYLYADFGEGTYRTPGIFAGRTSVELQTHTVRMGLSYKFATGKAPVVTRY